MAHLKPLGSKAGALRGLAGATSTAVGVDVATVPYSLRKQQQQQQLAAGASLMEAMQRKVYCV